jgi:hypothetical protein
VAKKRHGKTCPDVDVGHGNGIVASIWEILICASSRLFAKSVGRFYVP